jgi:hypothetical protein
MMQSCSHSIWLLSGRSRNPLLGSLGGLCTTSKKCTYREIAVVRITKNMQALTPMSANLTCRDVVHPARVITFRKHLQDAPRSIYALPAIADTTDLHAKGKVVSHICQGGECQEGDVKRGQASYTP